MNNKKNKKRVIIKLVIFILLIILVIVGLKAWLPLPATFLAVKDNVQKADCIVPLQGDLYFRFKKAVELYNKGYSKNLVVSVLPTREKEVPDYHNTVLNIYGLEEASPKEFTLMAFKYFGKDSKGILFTDYDVTSTYEEAVATKDFMLKKGFKSLILITTAYHMRRALSLFKSIFRDTGIKIYNCSAGGEIYNPYRWWLKERDAKMVVLEYLSIVHNFIYHSLLKKERTSFDTYY